MKYSYPFHVATHTIFRVPLPPSLEFTTGSSVIPLINQKTFVATLCSDDRWLVIHLSLYSTIFVTMLRIATRNRGEVHGVAYRIFPSFPRSGGKDDDETWEMWTIPWWNSNHSPGCAITSLEGIASRYPTFNRGEQMSNRTPREVARS